jgi:hypothetical protein
VGTRLGPAFRVSVATRGAVWPPVAASGLAKAAHAGGLNESSSDLNGTLVEWCVNNATDPGDYLIGEKQNLAGASFVCYPRRGFKASPQNDPHCTSGIGNRAFYLMAEGALVPANFSGKRPPCAMQASRGAIT